MDFRLPPKNPLTLVTGSVKETTNNREELFKEGLLQAVFELASAYETGAITSERFAEKVCGLRNIYQKEIEDEVHSPKKTNK